MAEGPLQCYACLGFGHAAAACKAEVRRRGCTNQVQCPLCHNARRQTDHRMGGRACAAVRLGRPKRKKGPPDNPEQPGAGRGTGSPRARRRKSRRRASGGEVAATEPPRA